MTGADPHLSAQNPPPEAAAVFGVNVELARRYAVMLCGDGVVRGLIGPREPARIWSRHLLNGAALASWIGEGEQVIDVGSGAGLPGIPLLLARPDLKMTLLEPMARRAAFCEEVKAALGLELTVLRARAQEAPRGTADVVTARAVAPLDRLVAMTFPLLRPGGRLLALKGEQAQDEVRAAQDALARAGAQASAVHALGAGEDRTYVVTATAPMKALR